MIEYLIYIVIIILCGCGSKIKNLTKSIRSGKIVASMVITIQFLI